ncbi:hypothetical protein TNCV_3528821 [Trichonephila clavipes]|nr:hypothetical protein TNCV_3528821 [Trichonephila clavipes]
MYRDSRWNNIGFSNREELSYRLLESVVCRRYNAGPAASAPVALPEDRVRDATVIEITGIDLAVPFYLLNGDKLRS